MAEKYSALVKVGAALAASALTSSAAFAAQGPILSGNVWVAYAILGGLVAAIVLFVFASVGVERRDEALERGNKHHNELPGFPMLGDEEDGSDD